MAWIGFSVVARAFSSHGLQESVDKAVANIGRNDVKDQRKRIRCLCINGHSFAFRPIHASKRVGLFFAQPRAFGLPGGVVDVVMVDELNAFVAHLGIALSIVGVAKCLCRLRHDVEFVHQIAVEKQRIVVLIHLEAQPIAQADAIGEIVKALLCIDIFRGLQTDEALHGRIMGCQSLFIGILKIGLPRHDDAHRSP